MKILCAGRGRDEVVAVVCGMSVCGYILVVGGWALGRVGSLSSIMWHEEPVLPLYPHLHCYTYMVKNRKKVKISPHHFISRSFYSYRYICNHHQHIPI